MNIIRIVIAIGVILSIISCTNYNENIFKLHNNKARIIFSNHYSHKTPGNLLIYIHGNGQNHLQNPSEKALKFILENNYSYASIDIQDGSKEPFTNNNTGWGNDESYNRVLSLYQYLITEYKFNKEVIVAGGSMGGLTMGQIMVRDDIPLKCAIGIGPVPSLKTIWEQAPQRRTAIRNAYKLDKSGLEDSKMDSIFSKNDWFYLIQSTNKDLVDLYIYYGVDAVFEKDFGGLSSYQALARILESRGSNVTIKTNESTKHGDNSLYEIAVDDGVFTNY
ncbi:MAG TPA: hypothetical protein VK017_02855 [Sphingobacterium sp.]|nr:hypothetical protein [Sphingobacterium sp.]